MQVVRNGGQDQFDQWLCQVLTTHSENIQPSEHVWQHIIQNAARVRNSSDACEIHAAEIGCCSDKFH